MIKKFDFWSKGSRTFLCFEKCFCSHVTLQYTAVKHFSHLQSGHLPWQCEQYGKEMSKWSMISLSTLFQTLLTWYLVAFLEWSSCVNISRNLFILQKIQGHHYHKSFSVPRHTQQTLFAPRLPILIPPFLLQKFLFVDIWQPEYLKKFPTNRCQKCCFLMIAREDSTMAIGINIITYQRDILAVKDKNPNYAH